MTQRCDMCGHWKHWEAAIARPYPDDMLCRSGGTTSGVFTRPDWHCADWTPKEGVTVEESTDSLLARMPIGWTMRPLVNVDPGPMTVYVIEDWATQDNVRGFTARAALLAAFARWP